MFEQIHESMPPVRGIVHAAMVLDDALLAHVTPERFHHVLWPKAGGAWNLHRPVECQIGQFVVSDRTSWRGRRSGHYGHDGDGGKH